MFGKGVLLVLLVLGAIAYQAQAQASICKSTSQYCIAKCTCVIFLCDGYIHLLNSKGE